MPDAANPPSRPKPAPTLDDVAQLTPESDYAAFTAPQVDARVRNEALKKLFFTDPHFNTGDGLDVHAEADCESERSPQARQRQIQRARAFGLLDDELVEQDRPVPEPPQGAPGWGILGPHMKTLICDCNRTMPLDARALGLALRQAPGAATEAPGTVHSSLCRREAPAFQRAARSGEDLLVACTQEGRLFLELAEQTAGAPGLQERPIRFVNIRETGGWSKDASAATPKIAALIAAAQLPEPEPVAAVSYKSAGRCLIVGVADAAESAAAMLGAAIEVTLLATGGAGALSQRHDLAVHTGVLDRLTGHLGAFQATWTAANPIDLDLCTRCNACIAACPEGAIDFSYTVDLAACKTHRDCVRVCEAAGAIDFDRAAQSVSENFDLVLDLRDRPAFAQHAPPQGYFHVGRDERRLVQAVLKLRDLVGEFEKPRFFRYKPALCAHSRNEQIGCSACIEVCSARAIRSDASLKGKAGAKLRRNTPATPDPGGRAGASWSTRTCAWAAVPAPPCAPAAHWATRCPTRRTRGGACARCWPPTAVPAATMRPC